MPGGDRTGPMGQGPRTGRAAGYCSGYAVPGFMNGPGGGWMRGRGGGGRGAGRGWRNMFYATGLTGWQRAAAVPPQAPAPAPPPAAPQAMTEEDELAQLKAQAGQAAATLEQIRRRIDQIESARSREATE